ncbi:STAS domain-containing protein [Amycolatopsis sp. NPDC049688]|uniref:STAS domain-containing protein n=1 Tax=Amycolatopsis sp. NPDC049688 TaxID=3154733 RepID=UPI003431D03D
MRQWRVDCGGSAGIGITVRRIAEGAAVVAVSGEIDSSNGESLCEALHTALSETTWMIADFTGVTFCGSAGLRALLLTSEDCAGRGAEFVVLPSPVVRRAVEACCLGRELRLAGADDTVTTLLAGRS